MIAGSAVSVSFSVSSAVLRLSLALSSHRGLRGSRSISCSRSLITATGLSEGLQEEAAVSLPETRISRHIPIQVEDQLV